MSFIKKTFLFVLVFSGFQVFCQTDTYNQLVYFIHQSHPEISTEGKAIAACVWSSDNISSRETNKAYDFMFHAYEGATLKDSRKGMIFISISSDTDELAYTIAIKKDGVKDCIIYCDFKGAAAGFIKSLNLDGATNVVYSGKGELFFSNLDQTNVKSSLGSLITR